MAERKNTIITVINIMLMSAVSACTLNLHYKGYLFQA